MSTFIKDTGPYAADKMYAIGDAVTFGGAAYVSRSYPNVGNPVTDTAHWEAFGSIDPATFALLARETVVYLSGSGGGSKATPILTWPTPAGITYGTTLSSTQLNATASAFGTFTYSQPVGTVLNAGTQTLVVTFTPSDTSVYTSASASVTIAVAKATPSITWAQPPSLLYTDSLSAAQLNASVAGSGSLVYSPASGTTLSLGTHVLTATFTPADLANYTVATVTRSLTVTASSPPAALVPGQNAQSTGATATAPITLTLPNPPTVGNQLTVIIAHPNVGGRNTYSPLDPTWVLVSGDLVDDPNDATVTVATHIVVPGDGRSFVFYTVGGANSGSTAVIFETSGTAGVPQVAFQSYNPGVTGQQTPTLTPTAAGSLAVAFDYSAYSYPLPSGWSSIPCSFGLAQETALSDASTPISVGFGGYTAGGSVTGLILFAPGPICATPVPSHPAGNYADTQTVALACATNGATIHYASDGSVPTTASPVYSAPITFDRTTVLGVLATAPGYAPSGPALYNFIIAAGTLRGISLGEGASLNGYVPWANDAYHQDISASPVDPNSVPTMNLLNTKRNNLFADNAITYNNVDTTPGFSWSTPLVPFSANISPADTSYLGQCDVCPYPIPVNVGIEGNPPVNTVIGYLDAHALLVSRGDAAIYGLWKTTYGPVAGSRPSYYGASAASIFLLDRPDTLQRPYGFTSENAGGTCTFEGCARYDEIMTAIADGTMCLKHALRMTSELFGAYFQTGSGYGYFQLPATHSAATGAQASNATNLVFYGQRLRMKASFSVSTYSLFNQVILNTLKKRGAYLDDIGQTFGINIMRDPRIDQADLAALNAIPCNNTTFEMIQKGTVLNGAAYPAGPAPAITSFTSSAMTVTRGTPVTLTAV